MKFFVLSLLAVCLAFVSADVHAQCVDCATVVVGPTYAAPTPAYDVAPSYDPCAVGVAYDPCATSGATYVGMEVCSTNQSSIRERVRLRDRIRKRLAKSRAKRAARLAKLSVCN